MVVIDEGDLGLLDELKSWDIKNIITKPERCVIASATLDLLMADYEEFDVPVNRLVFQQNEENMSTIRIHPLLRLNPQYNSSKPSSKDNKRNLPLYLNPISGSWLLKDLIGKYKPNIVFFDDALALKSVCDYIAISRENEHYSEDKAWNPIEGDYVMQKDNLYGATSTLYRCNNVISPYERTRLLFVSEWNRSNIIQVKGRIRNSPVDMSSYIQVPTQRKFT
jgi:hypothetical protein